MQTILYQVALKFELPIVMPPHCTKSCQNLGFPGSFPGNGFPKTGPQLTFNILGAHSVLNLTPMRKYVPGKHVKVIYPDTQHTRFPTTTATSITPSASAWRSHL